MYLSCKVENELNEHRNESSLKVSTNYDCNDLDCKYVTLLTMKCCDTICNNWFHHLCQKEYNSFKLFNEFDNLQCDKNRCKNMLIK